MVRPILVGIKPCFTRSDRGLTLRARDHRCWSRANDPLLAIARAALPEGRFFAGAGTRAIDKVENFLTLSPPSVATGYPRHAAGARRVGAGRASRAARVAADGEGAGAARELAWRRLRAPHMVRLLTVPLKIAHYNDPKMYADVGCRYSALPVREERPRYMERVTAGGRARRRSRARVRRRRDRHRRGRRGGRARARRAGPRGRVPRRGRATSSARLHRPRARHAAQAVSRRRLDVLHRQRRDPDPARPDRRRHDRPSTPAPATARPIACCAMARRARAGRARARRDGAATSSASRRCSASRGRGASMLGGNGRVIARGCDALGFTRTAARAQRARRATARACAASAARPTPSARPTSRTCRSRCAPARAVHRRAGRARHRRGRPRRRRRRARPPTAHAADRPRARGRDRVRLDHDAAALLEQRPRRRVGPARHEPLDPSRVRRPRASSTSRSCRGTASRRATRSRSSTTRASCSRARWCRSR